MKDDILQKYNEYKQASESGISNKEKYKKYEDSILKDLPRSYPKSHWLSNKTNKNLIKDILRCWLCYSEIGYIQSMLFYLIPDY